MIKVETVQNRRYLLLLQLSLRLHLFPEKTKNTNWPLTSRLLVLNTQENEGKVKKILPCEPFKRRFWFCCCHGGLTTESVFINLNFLNLFFFFCFIVFLFLFLVSKWIMNEYWPQCCFNMSLLFFRFDLFKFSWSC